MRILILFVHNEPSSVSYKKESSANFIFFVYNETPWVSYKRESYADFDFVFT